MPDSLNLTFGVEIECIICFDPATYEERLSLGDDIFWEDQRPSPYRRENRLRVFLRNNIVSLFNAWGYPTYDVNSAGGNQKWTVTNESSIETKDGQYPGFLECDIEIKSPAMLLCPKALRRVRNVVKLVTRNFDVFTNETCGLHVHIGNQKKGFPLQTLKNFSMLTAMFEHQLSTLHPPHRIDNYQVKGPSVVFKGRNPWDTMQRIQNCESKDELVLLYADCEGHPDKGFAYNLIPMVSGPYKTIEFRQHKGTVDYREIIKWIQVAGGIVDETHNISADRLAELVDANAFDPTFTICDLLHKLKLEALAPFYTGKWYSHLRHEPLWVPSSTDGSVPRRHETASRWDELERRHKIERLEEMGRQEALEKRHQLERRRELERQEGEAVAQRETSE